jgi:hypothetical protein
MIEDNIVPQKKENALERELDDQVVVLSPDGNELITFEGSARFIWDRIDGVRTIEQILDGITEEFQVEASVARKDLEVFLVELQGRSLILL